jgi:hypothetical protein
MSEKRREEEWVETNMEKEGKGGKIGSGKLQEWIMEGCYVRVVQVCDDARWAYNERWRYMSGDNRIGFW